LKPGSYELTWDPELRCSDDVWNRWRYEGDKAKARVRKSPKLVSAKAWYIAFRLDGDAPSGDLLVILDESRGAGKGYDTAYVDTNRNFDLSDDEPLHWAFRKYEATSPWIEVKSHQGPAGAETADNSLMARVSVYNDGDSQRMARLQRKGGWRGTVQSGKGGIDFILVDSNFNGIYGDYTRVENGLRDVYLGDCAFADTTGQGRAIPTDYGPHALQLAEATKVGERYCTIQSNGIGNRVTISPYADPTGTLFVRGENILGFKAAVGSIYATGEHGIYSLRKCEGKAVSLPAGRYRIDACEMALQTKNSQPLNVSCNLDDTTEVKPDEQTEVVIGGKLSMAINPEKKELLFRPNEAQGINWNIKIGDKVTLSSIGDRSQDQAPTVKFYDKNGKLLATTTAGYT
jgi:hypothetical protein